MHTQLVDSAVAHIIVAVRQQVQLSQPLYEKRRKLVSQIPNFWPLVIEQAPPDIDEYIQPSDAALLLTSLTSLSVSRFEVENGGNGDPRSVAIKWEFNENEYFEDTAIEKKFWWRRSKDGWAGLVSEPVDIRWKKGKDLTGGMLSMVKRVWDEELGQEGNGSAPDAKTLTPSQRALKKKIENTGLGGLSFFAWFGFRGKKISAEENRLAAKQEQEKRALRLNGKASAAPDDEEEAEAEDKDEDEDDEDSLEIFPDGDNLAMAITDDLWPGAIKYFSESETIRHCRYKLANTT